MPPASVGQWAAQRERSQLAELLLFACAGFRSCLKAEAPELGLDFGMGRARSLTLAKGPAGSPYAESLITGCSTKASNSRRTRLALAPETSLASASKRQSAQPKRGCQRRIGGGGFTEFREQRASER